MDSSLSPTRVEEEILEPAAYGAVARVLRTHRARLRKKVIDTTKKKKARCETYTTVETKSGYIGRLINKL